MGVRGLLNYVLRNKNNGTTQIVDLILEASKAGRAGVTLLIDLVDFAAWFLPKVDSLAKEYLPDSSCTVLGGEYAYHDEAISAIVCGLRAAGVFLEFFVDAPRGCGLVDAVTGSWTDEAKRRYTQDLDCAKAVRQWFRGERSDLPDKMDDAHCQPSLWYDQLRSSLLRCGVQVWHLSPEEQAPLLYMGRNSALSHVWGVVSDNIDWAVVRGVRLVPFACFDVDGELLSKALAGTNGHWPALTHLSIGFTCADLIAEMLRLGHPPRDEEVKEAQGKGKGKGPVGYGQWPYKWWNEQVLVELALLCGTDGTTPFLQRHKVYQQLQLQVGADPVESIVRWVRNQLYSNKLRWRDVQLEALSPVISDLVAKDREFELALEASRAVYHQSLSKTKAAYTEIERLRAKSDEKSDKSSVLLLKEEERPELPEGCSLLLRSAAIGRRVCLDVVFEDVARNGAPLVQQLLGDLRRLTYCLLFPGAEPILETGIAAEQRTGVHTARVSLGDAPDDFPTLSTVGKWSFQQRWVLFRKIAEHNALQAQAIENAVPKSEGETPTVPVVERVVWNAYQVTTKAAACTDASFLHTALGYFLSMNHRPEVTLIREHEFDSLAALIALQCDASLPGAPLEEAPEWAQQRFGEVKNQLCGLVSGNFHQNSEVRIPARVSILGAWFQGSVRHLLDLARLLWLDAAEAGRAQVVWLPEPRELFSGTLFASLYVGGAYDEWEMSVPYIDTAYHWKSVFRQLSDLRKEVVQSQWFRNWKKRFLSDLPKGSVRWPSKHEVEEAKQKAAKESEELPIDEHREKILAHIDKYRVTCIQGETGCGKSTRVPVYVMEDYFEKKRKGELEENDKFMALCTQPRRIACISLANRVASCLKERLGESIGYKISGDSNVRPGKTKCVYVTTGYLLQVLVNNPDQIRQYSHLILDEVHERDVDSDLLSLVIKLQMEGYNFKLVIMSATLQGDLFSRYFSDKKIKTIFVGVKRFPVEVLYLENLHDRYGGRSWDERNIPEGARGYQAPFSHMAGRAIRDGERMFGTTGYEDLEDEAYQQPTKGEFDDSDDDDSSSSGSEFDEKKQQTSKVAKKPYKERRREVTPQIMRGLDILLYEVILRVANPGEGILVFLPGIGEITEIQETLMPLEDPERESQMSWDPHLSRPDVRFKVFVLHSLIPKDEQEGAVFDAPAPDCCHVILASNIAESSLTIPKVRVVVDFGLRRQLVYDKKRHMSCLVTRWVSQASAKQRTGRTGRVFEGVNIRFFSKQFHETRMEEFDPPEMQTAPLEKLYVNVKHLSAKLPEYQISPTEKRRRTPKELLSLVAQPPDVEAVETSITVLDNLGALTGPSEDASLTALGYLMMSVPLDVQLCRLVIFGAIFSFPCDGVVLAAGLSVQDPFTLPSHLIIKDPREYAEALKRSYESRLYFDHGHLSEPLMFRAVFVEWLAELRKVLVDRCNGRKGGYRRENTRAIYLRAAQVMSSKFALVPKRLINYANSVSDTTQRMRKFLPPGSDALKRLDNMLGLLQGGDKYFASSEEADAQLPKLDDLFCTDAWTLKILLVASFAPQFMVGSTKIRNDEPVPEETQTWGKKKKQKAPPKKEKNKMEQLLEEMVKLGCDPTKTVVAQLELPRGKGAVSRYHPRFMDDLKLTVEMMTCKQEFSLQMSGENKVLISFPNSDDVSPFEAHVAKVHEAAKLRAETGLLKDLPTGPHMIDLYGAGRFKFQVPMLSSEKAEQEKAEKAAKEKARRDALEKAKADREAKAKASAEAREAKAKAAAEAKEARERAKKEAEEKAKEAKEKAKNQAMKVIEEKATREGASSPKKSEEREIEEAKSLKEYAGQVSSANDKTLETWLSTLTPAATRKLEQALGTEKDDDASADVPTTNWLLLQLSNAAITDKDIDPDLAEFLVSPISVQEMAPESWLNVWELICVENPWLEMRDGGKPVGTKNCPYDTLSSRWASMPHLMSDSFKKKVQACDKSVGSLLTAVLECYGEKNKNAEVEEKKDTEKPKAVALSLASALETGPPGSLKASPNAETPADENVAVLEVDEDANELEDGAEAFAASIAKDNNEAKDLGPMIGIYKPVTPYEVNWTLMETVSEEPVVSKKGKAKKKKVMQGRCNWRNNFGFLSSVYVPEENKAPGYSPEPFPNDMYSVYTTTQGGDSKDLSWVDGVTLLPAENDNVLAFIMLITFLREFQELSIDVDLQCGRIHTIRSHGVEFAVPENQVLLVEDIDKINALRQALSNSFWTAAKAKVSEEDQDKGLDFTGYQGRRDDEIVPQIGNSVETLERLNELLTSLRRIGQRNETISEQEWNARCILWKPKIQTVNMHRPSLANASSISSSSSAPRDSDFVFYSPYTDLAQVKRDAEREQEEQEIRRRQQEEEKQRMKRETQKQKAEAKAKAQRLKAEQERERERQRREAQAQAKAKAKAEAKGKGKAKADGKGGKSQEPQQQQQTQQGKRGRKGKDGPETSTPAQQSQPSSSHGQGKGSKGSGGGNKGGSSPQSNLPPPWVAVPDPSSGRTYYWNQLTNEVQWEPPSQSSAQPDSWSHHQQMMMMMQQMYQNYPGYQ